MLAITRLPSPRMDRCELTFVGRAPLDLARAGRQHAAYCELLRDCGADVVALPPDPALPDCAFVEDTAVVLDELAVLASMGTAARAGEIDAAAEALRRHRRIVRIEPPATLEGGDVLRVGKTLLVGLSRRTNRAGCEALARVVREHGHRVVPVRVTGCLHLKTACTALDDETLLINPAWIDCGELVGFDRVNVPEEEPWAANVLPIGGVVCVAAAHGRTAEMLARRGSAVRTVDIAELAKAEAGVTCLCLLVG